ncbi:hypothetical protein JKP88DRAFT_221612 [Tribonema minus]|uniref:Uncharacterized protein n=1 Tax=Tribonema minus TaxID=303371 RepID=A0A836CDP9_9STRA|nr:hypothetical protein JKP88DRAFT_221612 [Tribonema minus]
MAGGGALWQQSRSPFLKPKAVPLMQLDIPAPPATAASTHDDADGPCAVCAGTGFVPCGDCAGAGHRVLTAAATATGAAAAAGRQRSLTVTCPVCVGYAKVRCTACGGRCYLCAD